MSARSTRKSRKSSKRKTRKNDEDAGAAIAAGGFGCVFRPPIMPRDSKDIAKVNSQPYISKLMQRRYAREEMAEVNKILPVVKKIPNSSRYFLLDGIFMTERFGPLNSEDKRNFDSKCRNITRMGINANNINNNLGGLACMYIPDGGISINEAMKQLSTAVGNGSSAGINIFGRLNYALIDTLENAIVPMNKLGLIHLDLKGDNMLVSSDYSTEKKLLEVKIIDWGLAGIIPNDSSGPIDAAQDRPIQFNCPPTAVLFNGNTQDAIARYIRVVFDKNYTKTVFSSAACKNLAAFIIKNSQQRVGEGHSRYVAQEVRNLTRPMFQYRELEGWNVDGDCFQKDSMVQAFTVNYVAAALEAYLKPGTKGGLTYKFLAKEYFQEVYRHNVDVWGFLMSYQDLINNIASSSYTAYRKSTVCQLLSDILFKYCYSPDYAAKKIPINDLKRDLELVSAAAGVKSSPARKTAAAVKIAKKKLVLRQASPAPAAAAAEPSVVSIPAGKKRCPKGYTKEVLNLGQNATKTRCRKKGTKANKRSPKAKNAKKAKKANKTRKSPTKNPTEYITFKEGGKSYIQLRDRKRRRCPKGYSKVKVDNGYLICEKK